MNKLGKIFLISLLVLPTITFAQPAGTDNGLSIDSLGHSIINVIWIVFTVMATVCFVIAGIMFLTSMGDADKISKARSMAIWGVAGIVVGILAFSIIELTKTTLGA